MQDYFNTTGESRIGEGDAEGVALASLAEEMDWEEPQRKLPFFTRKEDSLANLP